MTDKSLCLKTQVRARAKVGGRSERLAREGLRYEPRNIFKDMYGR